MSRVYAHWLKKGREQPLLDEGYSMSFNFIGAAFEATMYKMACTYLAILTLLMPLEEANSKAHDTWKIGFHNTHALLR